MPDYKKMIFSGMQILQADKWVAHHALVVEEGKIAAIMPEKMVRHHASGTHIKLPADYMLVPGFLDLHVHGAKDSDVMDASIEALTTISLTLAAEGVTGYLATTMTATPKKIEAALKVIPAAMQHKFGAKILGVHLEGPFIAEDKRGAQRLADLQAPDVEKFHAWQSLSQDAIKLVTLAPELPNAEKLIAYLKEKNIIVAIGHTNATYQQTADAINAGCSHATHLFNAMRGVHQREPGAAGALLLSDKVSADLIVDGMHLHPAIVELAYRVKGKENLMLISDAMRAKCMVDGLYDLGGQEVHVKDGKAVLVDGTLAGSVLKLPQAIKNMVQYSQCTLIDAIKMVSYNPARKLKIETQKGSIEIGKDADFVLLNPNFDVMMTLREGNIIFQK